MGKARPEYGTLIGAAVGGAVGGITGGALGKAVGSAVVFTRKTVTKVGESVIGGMSSSKSGKSQPTTCVIEEIDDEETPGVDGQSTPRIHGAQAPQRPPPIQYHPQQGPPQPSAPTAPPRAEPSAPTSADLYGGGLYPNLRD
jgi:hypothetical protein